MVIQTFGSVSWTVMYFHSLLKIWVLIHTHNPLTKSVKFMTGKYCPSISVILNEDQKQSQSLMETLYVGFFPTKTEGMNPLTMGHSLAMLAK